VIDPVSVPRGMRNRIEVMHGVNLDQLGRRDPSQYGQLTITELEREIAEMAAELGLETRFFQTNHEGEFVEHLHRLQGLADGVVLNPGAWTHYSYAIRDALELVALPAVEVHLSDVEHREEWRRRSVIRELCIGRFSGKGPGGYREALVCLRSELSR
jgi:3-dehydroquinate dehydratase II